jgi:hypothetical protein
MTCRLPSARLRTLALLGSLAVPALAAAKPPDLPENQQDTLAPQQEPLGGGAIISWPGDSEQPMPPSRLEHLSLLALDSSPASVDGATSNETANPWVSLLDYVRNPSLTGISGPPFQVHATPPLLDVIEQVIREGIAQVSSSLPRLSQGLELSAAPPSLRPAQVPVPALYRLGVTARQNLACSLLLGIHPLLMLAPTADILDAPGDHPQPVAGDDILSSCPPQPTAPLARFLVAERSDAAAEPPAEQLHAMPKEEKAAKTDFTCPYLRQQAADRHVRQMADPDVTQDVLGNLNKLLEADCLFELAGELLRAGCVSEATACYDAVCRLVPGSRFEAQVAEALAEFGVGAPAEAAEEPKSEPQGKVDTDSWLDLLGRLADALGLPVPRFINVYSSDPNVRIQELINDSEDLRQIECEWKRIWFTDQPSHLTGGKAGVAEQVAGLMKACRLAAESGETGRAADLARQAYALDPERVTADPLVYKMHLLTADTQKGAECPAAPCQPRGDLECPRWTNPPEGRTEEAEPPVMLRPMLPPVDPDVVNALDAMLHECRVVPVRPEANYPLCESEEHAASQPPVEDGGLMDVLPGLHGQMEFGVDLLDAGVRVSCDVRCAGQVFHLVYREGGFAFWTTHDASATAEGEGPK